MVERKVNSMDEPRRWLTGQFWDGKRWVVLETSAGIVGIYGCYSDYLDAADVCRRSIPTGKALQVRILGSLLKELNGIVHRVAETENQEHLSAAIGKYPLRLFGSSTNWEEELLLGNFYPMVWIKSMHPLLAVHRFIVVLDRKGAPSRRKELYTSSEFPHAILALERYGRSMWDQNVSLSLIGQLQDGSFARRCDERQSSKKPLIFFRAECRKGKQLEIEQVRDPTRPVLQEIPVLVRYFSQRRELAFYDGRLKRIRPGDEPGFIDLSVFDFRKKVL